MTFYFWLLFITIAASLHADCSIPGATPGTGSAAEPCHALSPADIESAIQRAAQDALGSETALRIEILDYPHQQIPEGEIRFSFRGAPPAALDGTSIVHGKIESHDSRTFPIWARVHLLIRRTANVAVQDLEARVPLRDGMVEKREVWVPYPDSHLSEPDCDLATLSGAQLKRAIRAGQPVYASFVDLPLDIRRGQTVDLHVRNGAAHLRLQATAMQDARRGERVQLRLVDREPQFTAIASGPGSAELRANQTNANPINMEAR